jgi:hypothetical protein
LLAAFRSLHQKVAGTPADFRRVEQRPRGVGWRPSPGSGRYSIDDLSPGFAGVAVGEYLDSVLGHGDQCFRNEDATSMQRLSLLSVVRSWLADDPSIAYLGDPTVERALRRFAGRSESERRAWFAAHYVAVRDCTLTPAALGA